MNKNKIALWLIGGGIGLSILSFLLFFVSDLSYKYNDAQNHLLLTRRVCDSSSPGLAQLGAVWLPGSHLLGVPFVCSDLLTSAVGVIPLIAIGMVLSFLAIARLNVSTLSKAGLGLVSTIGVILMVMLFQSRTLYTEGIGLTIISMVSYVAMGWLVYLTVVELTNNRSAGILAWLIVMLNPNMLYMQSTPMTELPLYLGVAASSYTFTKLMKNTSSPTWIFWNGIANFSMALIRYEGWFVIVAQACLYGLVVLVQHLRQVDSRQSFWQQLASVKGHVIFWSMLSLAGIIGWFAWNATIYGNPLEFHNGVYSKPSNWVAGSESSLGNPVNALLTYLWGTWHAVGPISVIGFIGLLLYPIATRKNFLQGLAPLMPLVLIPFFVYSLNSGQRPMKIMEVEQEVYNARFALVMALVAAPVIATVFRQKLMQSILAIFVIGSFLHMALFGVIVTLYEPIHHAEFNYSEEEIEAAEWFAENYTNGLILMEGYGNEQFQFASGMDLAPVIYEGTFNRWDQTLADPVESDIEWVVMRGLQHEGYEGHPEILPDIVWRTHRTTDEFHSQYELVYRNFIYEIYRLRTVVEE